MCFIAVKNSPASAAFKVGHGGDFVHCTASRDNFLKGDYSLDYLLTLDSKTDSSSVAPVTTWQASLQRMQTLLDEKVPSLGASLREFVPTILNKSDLTMSKIWEPAPFGLVDIKDEYVASEGSGSLGSVDLVDDFIAAQLPDNCKVNGVVKLMQAVIRLDPAFTGSGKKVIFKYLPDVIDEAQQKSPLQLSYLFVHEWLWDLSSNVERNRRMNKLFHSVEFTRMSAEEALSALRGLNYYPPEISPPAFEKGICTGPALDFADLQAKHTSSKNILFAVGRYYARNRLEKCDQQGPMCEKSWHPYNEQMINILSPDAAVTAMLNVQQKTMSLSSPNLSGLGYEVLMNCKFKPSSEHEIICQVTDKKLLPLTDGDGSLSGVITQDCLHLQSTKLHQVSMIGGEYSGEATVRFENAFYLQRKR